MKCPNVSQEYQANGTKMTYTYLGLRVCSFFHLFVQVKHRDDFIHLQAPCHPDTVTPPVIQIQGGVPAPCPQ